MPVREAEALLLHKTGSETVQEVEPGVKPLGPPQGSTSSEVLISSRLYIVSE